LNKADQDLFLYGLSMGDLIQLHSNSVDPDNELSTKVIAGYNYTEDTTHGWLNRGWYFRYIESETLGIYMHRVVQGANEAFWAKFHKIHVDGVSCIVHEKFLYPSNWVYDPNVINYHAKKLYSAWNTGSS